MPFINVKIAGRPLARDQIASIQAGTTRLMVDILHKVGPLVGGLVAVVDGYLGSPLANHQTAL